MHDDSGATLRRALDGVLDGALDGEGGVREAGPDDHVAGVPARWVVRPTSVAGVAAVMAASTRTGAVVVARGAGTALDWGCPPERLDVVLDLTGLDRLVEHEPGDLVVVTQAGIAVQRLGELLAQANQELAIDLPQQRFAGGGTIGGALATGATGPRRLLHGGLRDLLLGATVVLADGTVAASGGKVVKNVAGYDLAKLMVGSYGTLGIVVQAAWRLHPLPSARRIVVAEAPLERAAALARQVIASQLAPAAVEIDRPGGSEIARVAVLLQGSEQATQVRASALCHMFTSSVNGSVIDSEVVDQAPSWWGALPPGEVLMKATATLPGVASLLVAARDAEQGFGASVAVRGSASGVLHVALDGDPDPAAVAGIVARLRAASASVGDGAVTVVRASADTRAVVDVWGEVPGLALMRRVKAQFDPQRRLAPGRFVGGI